MLSISLNNMKTLSLVILILLITLGFSRIYSQPRINLIKFTDGFTNPVCITNAGDDRLFIVEQAGKIIIVDSLGNANGVPFLDIRDRVVSGGEQGLLGLAFHPNYAINGYFYVNYTGAGDSTHISRFSISQSIPDSSDPASEVKLLTIYQPYTNHNGGDLNFGPDGYLYIGMGDGGSAGDPGNRAQNLLEYLGKILRIDVDEGNPYSIPATNPFAGNPAALGEIWALGVRNPWRFSFDRLTGDLWIADVGQNTWEEIDFQPASSTGGENYGWRCYEGNSPYNTTGCVPIENYTFPIYVYSHSPSNDCSVTGGYVYRGSKYPNFTSRYFFSDYCSDNIWTIHDSLGIWKTAFMGQFSGNNFCTFGESAKGELYIAGYSSGSIFTITDNTAGAEDYGYSGDFAVYPNPFTRNLKIELKQKDIAKAYLAIIDLQGSIVYSCDVNGKWINLKLGFLKPGIYYLRLTIQGEKKFVKLIKI
jgi:glucose/arabinose dehydrogenase